METSVKSRIREVLKSRGWDDQTLAAKMEKHPSVVSRMLSKEGSPSKTTLQLAAKALEVNYNWLITGEGSQETAQPAADGWHAAYESEKSKTTLLQKELARAWALVEHFSGGKVNFPKPVNEAAIIALPAKEAAIIALPGQAKRKSA